MTAGPATASGPCPRCGSDRAIPIVYGLPGDHRLIDQAQRGELELGGCCIDPSSPGRRCTRCGFGFEPIDLEARLPDAMTGELNWTPSERFERALAFAVDKHRDQPRKGSGTPYVGHLLAVCSLVIEDGGSEDEAIAALLHDAAEDAGGEPTLDEIGERFGADVRRIVASCSDTFEMPKPAWRQRKEDYVAAIASKRPDELRVSLADKVHNPRSILFDFRAVGEEVFDRFKADRDETLWYYRALADAFAEHRPGPLAVELDRVVSELEAEVG